MPQHIPTKSKYASEQKLPGYIFAFRGSWRQHLSIYITTCLLRELLAFWPRAINNPAQDEKAIIFLRHGCTYMNEFLGRGPSFGAPHFTDVFDTADLSLYRDSPLSPHGRKQASMLARQMPPFSTDCDLIVVSPLTRALQTFDLGLRPHLSPEKNPISSRGKVAANSPPIVALPLAAERLYLISDVGRSTTELKKEFPYVDFESGFANSDTSWWYIPSEEPYVEWRPTGKGQRYACPGEPQDVFDQRMRSLYHWLDQRPEKQIAIISHWGVIDWYLDMDFDNCQWRKVPHESLRHRVLQVQA